MKNNIPVTLRRLLIPESNINKWYRDENGVYVPESHNSGFTLFDTVNPYPLFFDGTYKIGSMSITPKIGDTEYIDNTYREMLNNKIKNHYLDYRIGFETPNLFYHHFNTLLNEIMPEINAKYRLLWGFFAEKLPYGYFEHEDINGGNKNTYNSDVTNKKGDVKNYDWSGSVNGQSNDDTSSSYDFDTPQNISDLNVNSPSHMSNANVSKSKNGTTYNINGQVHLDGVNPIIYVDDQHPTTKSTFEDDKTENRGYDTNEYVNRNNEKYGYTSNDFKLIKEFNDELSNIDLEVIKKLRDCFLYVYF